ncbi:uncharacterized protein LOC121595216 [Anopheles merus]|uniref:uncharacterized protein LOC121595216 n=1 Tax=Anopheles merus TaxID=30066 RepID=UPI001BE48A74|nr:uncharacterized protein LOC121595216 [Anopheles merus]
MYNNLVAKEYKDIYDLIGHVMRCEMHYQMRELPAPMPRMLPANRFTSTPSVNTKTQPANKREEVRCYNCSSFGHYSNQCRKPRQPVQSCFLCGDPDHKRQECPRVSHRMPAAVFAPCDQEIFTSQQPNESNTLRGYSQPQSPLYSINDGSRRNQSVAVAVEDNYRDDSGIHHAERGVRIDPVQEPYKFS